MAEIKNQTIVNERLVAACKKGDQQAQTQLYKLYYKAMYNTSLRIIRDQVEAEDIMQEAFLKAFRLLPKTNLELGFGGWLKKMVTNMSIDALRKKKIHFELVDEVRDDTYDYNLNVDNSENISDKILKIKQAMIQLPAKYRIVLSLNLLEGYDHNEISEILGIAASTSRAQLSRAKQKLIQLLSFNNQ
ncbi:MAG: sigma-70 family RNA polymerase sigma factor [Bacteroidales bacterium]|nr:sigma-70 family RNA polymerase sigma factor [Bacteroidales bacterium]